jgi:catechol 2,3-dioxygenase-like lactoylglutathione lyase family enzyme
LTATSIDHVSIGTPHLERSVRFYATLFLRAPAESRA